MSKRLTTDEFIEKAMIIHGGKYNYDKTVYVNNHTKVIITCPNHGDFEQTPNAHNIGEGCSKCKVDKLKKIIYGEGINDLHSRDKNGNVRISYDKWRKMIVRCYSEGELKKHITYINCYVCEEWKTYSNFKKWFDENYVSGYELDKDLLIKNNKIYSPQTCCFIPHRINSILTKSNSTRGKNPIGVYFNKSKGGYTASVCENKYRFNSPVFKTKDDAFNAYKKEKERYIKEVANEYYNKRLITEDVFNALNNYKVEITD